MEYIAHTMQSEAERAIIECFQNGGKLLLCGNGGSAADCAHIAGELVKGFMKKRPLRASLAEKIGMAWAARLQTGLPAIDLTAQGALIAAVCNDQGAENVYAQQALAYGRPGDVIIGISTSGNAENVLRALLASRAAGLTTIALTGKDGGKLRGASDILLNVPETETYKVQEAHIRLYHQICANVENALFEQ